MHAHDVRARSLVRECKPSLSSADPVPAWRPAGPWSDDFPTRGHHVNVWGYLLELIADADPVLLQQDGRLREVDASTFSRRSVWPASLIHSAFGYLLQQGLVLFRHTDGRAVASVGFARLADRLRHEHQFEIENPSQAAAYRALAYFRARQFHARIPWLARVMQVVDRAPNETVKQRGGDRAES